MWRFKDAQQLGLDSGLRAYKQPAGCVTTFSFYLFATGRAFGECAAVYGQLEKLACTCIHVLWQARFWVFASRALAAAMRCFPASHPLLINSQVHKTVD